MNTELRVGDIVYLNSKPEVKLTVSKIVDNIRVELTYYDEITKEFKKFMGARGSFTKVS
ncbi:hypothetical protein LJC28_01675 [Dysgonomonas sp. OttesenSCG-928-D17]|nr:hypothetical protein [Dysgonomonas sp. OttesenSCG-928-D17]